ncbi:hypothetical protein AAON49_09865 [Pseudotenacibaculum sp. MALMAid0570]|uniref:hypothetical protein n=1 Tax=Pseudotenacibaculum sp. MALMAid0570 TaxID=3143938 RepID=UPI0032DF1442
MNQIDFASRIHITDNYVFMDGGSLSLTCKDKNGLKFNIDFIQRVFWEIYSWDKIPGRIYLNNVIVEQRSEEEKKILHSLENPIYLCGTDFEECLKESIKYVKSDKYLSDVQKIVIKTNRE